MRAAYPSARRTHTVDVLHGVSVSDPYRWLEDAGSEETEAWVSAQGELLEEWWAEDGRARLRTRFAARMRDLLPGFVSAPTVKGEYLFFSRRDPEQDHPVYVVAGPAGERVLIDPSELSADHTTTLDASFPSKRGTRLAYTLSEAGAEEDVLRVMDVATGEVIDGPIVCGRAADVAWIDEDTFFYVRRLPDDQLPEGEGEFHRRVWWHRVGTPVADDIMVFGDGRDKTTYYGISTSPDGDWLLAWAALGTEPRNDLYLAAVGDPTAMTWTTLQEGVDARTYGGFGHDGRLYIRTDREAPRGRLLRADLSSPTAWHELVPEGEAVLEWAVLTEDALVVSRNRNVVAEVEVLDLTSGASRGKVDLPGLGAVSITTRDTASPDLWVSYTDFVTPLKVLHTQIAGGDIGPLTTWADPPGAVVAVGAATRQEWVTSPDGTQVPMFIIAKGDPTEPRPTVLYGYGGFNVSLAPAYAATAAAWVEAGGVWAEANLRGGSEFGEEWHRDGMRANKQHVFDDFIASAQWLIDHGWTTPDQLGIYGGSNGGLLVGATMTQAPTLFRAVVCSAPLLDMVRYEKFGLGVTWNDEYGTADDPEELGWLLGYSPYHRVADGTRYPATLFTVFDSDTRVDPLHARKMCAALQASTTAPLDDAPVLFRREAKVGHATRSIGRSIELAGDILGFLADQLGLGGGT